MDTKLFEEIGFTKGEVKVYFALLDLGSTTIGPISRGATITPAKVYPILDKLIAKGLVSWVVKENTRYYQAADPKRFLDVLDDQKTRIDHKRAEIKSLLPTLMAKRRVLPRQTATVFEGLDGMRTVYNEVIEFLSKTEEDFIGFSLPQYSPDANLFFKQFDLKRAESGITTKLIAMEDQRTSIEKYRSKNPALEFRYVDQQIPFGVIIWDHKVATLVWKNLPTAFVIESEQAAQTYRTFFWSLWKQGKK